MKWEDGGWAVFDLALGGFAWQQRWEGKSFDGCSSSVTAWDVNQVCVQGARCAHCYCTCMHAKGASAVLNRQAPPSGA